MKSLIIIICLFFFQNMEVGAQILTPAIWNYEISNKNPKQGEVVELVFTVKLDKNWQIYSNKQNYKIGPLPSKITFKADSSYSLVGNVEAIGSKKKYDDVFEVEVSYFEKVAKFRQKIKLLAKTIKIKGVYEYQVCSTVDGKCIMDDDEFEVVISTN